MRRVLFLLALVVSVLTASAQAPKGPDTEYVMTLNVKLGQAYGVGQTAKGNRFIIPITGGTFEGPNIKGTVLEGGADYQLQDQKSGRTEIEAIYCIRTDDGVTIHIRNCGIIYNGKDADGKQQFYFKAAPKFEAPMDSKYAWLNNSLFLCEPSFEGAQGGIKLNVWRVK